MAEGDYFSLIEQESSKLSWKFYLSPDLWDWIHNRQLDNSVFRASNQILLVCSDKCIPGFGNGNRDTLFLNRQFRGKVSNFGPKTDNGEVEANIEKISVALAEVVSAAQATEKTFSSPIVFPPGTIIVPQAPGNYAAAFEKEIGEVKKKWMLSIHSPFYNWFYKKRSFKAGNGIKIILDPVGRDSKGKAIYNAEKKMLLLTKECKDKQCKLPKKCYPDIQAIITALVEMSERYEITQPESGSRSTEEHSEEIGDGHVLTDAAEALMSALLGGDGTS